MVGVWLADSLLREFRERNGRLPTGDLMPGGAVLVHELLPLEHPQEVDLLEDSRRRGDHRLAHMRPGVIVALEDQVLDTRPREIRTHRRAGRTCADDDHFVHALPHLLTPRSLGPAATNRLSPSEGGSRAAARK